MFKKTLFILLFAGFCITSWAENISKYDVNIMVEQSGELSIVENIVYDFEKTPKHGIFRDIPCQIKFGSVIKDLGLYNFSVTFDNRPAQWTQTIMHSPRTGKVIRLKIGSPNLYITGKHTYHISYRVKKGVLPSATIPNYDSIRWNIIGTGWNVLIQNITAHFFLPITLTQKNTHISVFTGSYGSKENRAKTEWITSQILEVKIDKLLPHEGATVEIAYPPNALKQSGEINVKPTFADLFFANWHWAALAGFLLYFYIIFKKFGGFKDRSAIVVRYEPPKGMSVLQAGLILDKNADNEDLTAAILELANLGYLKILSGDEYKYPILKRIHKATNSLTMDQKYLLEEIFFKKKDTFILKSGSETISEKLKNGFNYINDNLYKWSVDSGYMVENIEKVRKFFLITTIFLLIPVVLLAGYTFYRFMSEDAIFAIFLSIAAVIGGLINLKQPQMKTYGTIGKVLIIFFVIFVSVLILQQGGISIIDLLKGPMGVIIIILIGMVFVYAHLGKFTKKGIKAQKYLLGLKEFIKRVKQDEIKRRLEEDSKYLEKMLPYAVLFKELEHWLGFFDLFQVPTPKWYRGDIYSIRNFSSAVNDAATPPDSSGGGFSGGGFSGGGGGGGGGGSW